MKKPRLVAFMGTVGSGKSTQIELLAIELRKKGLKVKTTFLKSNHGFAHLLSFFLTRVLIKNRNDPRRAHVRALIKEEPVIFNRLFKLWLTLDLFSITLSFLLKILLPTRMGYTVLVEDYLPATIVNYIYFTRAINIPSKTSSFFPRFMQRLIHVVGPTKWVFLDAEDGVLNSRWKNRRSVVEELDYLHEQRTKLLFLSKALSSHEVLYIDTTHQNIMETHELVGSAHANG